MGISACKPRKAFSEHVQNKLNLVGLWHIPRMYVLIRIDLISIKFIYDIGILEN